MPYLIDGGLISPYQHIKMSLSTGFTSSSHSFTYSKMSPKDFVNSTTATYNATSNNSTIIPSFPFLLSFVPCILTIWSSFSITLIFNFLATASGFPDAAAKNFTVNIDDDLFLISNKLLKSNPCDKDEIISNAL